MDTGEPPSAWMTWLATLLPARTLSPFTSASDLTGLREWMESCGKTTAPRSSIRTKPPTTCEPHDRSATTCGELGSGAQHSGDDRLDLTIGEPVPLAKRPARCVGEVDRERN